VPEALYVCRLREEAMAAEVEAIAVADHGLRQPADLVVGLEDQRPDAPPGEQVAGRQAGRPRADDHHLVVSVRHRTHSTDGDGSGWVAKRPAAG
jgi:hypothetical protein